MGAVVLLVPPVGVVYHRRLVPVAVRDWAAVFLQSVRFWVLGMDGWPSFIILPQPPTAQPTEFE